MQKTYNFAEKIRERVWMLWWQIKSDIREGIVQQWKRFAMLGIIYAALADILTRIRVEI